MDGVAPLGAKLIQTICDLQRAGMTIKSTLVLAELASALRCWLSWCYCGNIYNSIYLHDCVSWCWCICNNIWLMYFFTHLSSTQWM